MKHIVLFLATNLAILVVLTLIVRLFGLDAYLARAGSNLGTLKRLFMSHPPLDERIAALRAM